MPPRLHRSAALYRKKRRRRDSPTDSDSDSSSASDSAERKRAKAERLVRAPSAARASPARPRSPPRQARKLSEKLKKGGAVAGYTNDSNPFGDANLTQR